MENEPQLRNRLDELKDIIKNAAAGIESEFARTANDWLSCFGSKVFIIETYLSSKKIEELLPPEKLKEALDRLEKLKARLYELREQYPEKTTVPSLEIKKDLISQLDVFR